MDTAKTQITFSTETDMSNFDTIQDEFLGIKGFSYHRFNYAGYGEIHVDRELSNEEKIGILKSLIAEEKESDDWRYITEDEYKALITASKDAGMEKELNKAVKKLNKEGIKLADCWLEDSPIGGVKLTDGLSVDEVINIMKFETDLLRECY